MATSFEPSACPTILRTSTSPKTTGVGQATSTRLTAPEPVLLADIANYLRLRDRALAAIETQLVASLPLEYHLVGWESWNGHFGTRPGRGRRTRMRKRSVYQR